MKNFLFLVLAAIFCASSANAQKTIKVDKKYTYYAPANVTLEQAKQTAIERAKTEAIADEFGTLFQQIGVTNIKNMNGKSDVSFHSLGSSDVRGEWVRTIEKPIFHVDYAEEQLIVTVEIKGEIRELEYLKPQFISKLLRNGTKDHFEAEEFKEGDYLYFAFTSPMKGYLSLFVKDDSIRCLLPYVGEENGTLKIKANKRHLFFTEYGEKLQMFCPGATEVNAVYVLFSPNPIVRPLSENLDNGGMSVFTDEEYNKWLAKVRSHDKDLQMEIKYITISK